jgi:gluconolactonase
MWNLNFQPPKVIEASIWSSVPKPFRDAKENEWAKINKPGQLIDSFLEGPVFDAQGNFYVTDIPYGRIFRISPSKEWELVIQYDGWPNGLAIDREGQIWIADHKQGLLRLNPNTKTLETILSSPENGDELFLGLNDLVFDAKGNLFFTDQGQTGLHDPSGRVYCLEMDGNLHEIVSNVPSPNGLVFDTAGRFLFVSATRANNVWRMPIFEDYSTGKVGAFQTFFGTSGPDGLALDANDNLYVAHASLGGVFQLNKRGELISYIKTPVGHTVTNLCFTPNKAALMMTESSSGHVLIAPIPG